MPLVPRRGLLAIASVVEIALSATTRPLSAKHLAERYQLAPRHLEPILQNLVHVGILKGVRGPRGGYEMGRAPEDIRLDEVLEAALGPGGDGHLPFRDSPLIAAVVMPALAGAESALSRTLAGITVEALMSHARENGVSPDPKAA